MKILLHDLSTLICSRAKMAMEETLALEEAVEVAMSLTKMEETLTIVTADHSHAVTTNNGYSHI